MIRSILYCTGIFFISLVAGCKNEESRPSTVNVPKTPVTIPSANADSLFQFVEKQISFGTRVPGTPAHTECKNWLVKKLKDYGTIVQVQEFKASFLGQQNVTCYNIIAQINPTNKERVLLAAHWDSRMIAEKDPVAENRDRPIPGADDGASGVAGLLEIARVIHQSSIDLGVDLIFFDAEDQGVTNGNDQTWCLGSQYWSRNLHKRNYTAKFGILLDMIGAQNATFGKEAISRQYAPEILDKIWSLAQAMGYSDLFVNVNIGAISDDHFYVNRNAGIPMIDIINYNFQKNTFADYHHTHQDDLGIINKRNLRAVTQVVLATIYRESDRGI